MACRSVCLVVLALLCLSCSMLPGRSGSQHFQCSATPALDCSDLPLTLLSLVCLLICLLGPNRLAPSARTPRLGLSRFGLPQIGSLGVVSQLGPLRSASLALPPRLEPLQLSASLTPGHLGRSGAHTAVLLQLRHRRSNAPTPHRRSACLVLVPHA
jgi:hypothetical protein